MTEAREPARADGMNVVFAKGGKKTRLEVFKLPDTRADKPVRLGTIAVPASGGQVMLVRGIGLDGKIDGLGITYDGSASFRSWAYDHREEIGAAIERLLEG